MNIRYFLKTQKGKEIYSLPSVYFRNPNDFDYFLCLGSSETVSFFLPFARRAFKILRPLAVDILSLNPCLFFLFLFDG